MADSGPWSSLPHYWLHVQLPGYRELPEHHTYQGFLFEELPPIPIGLDDDCAWLMRYGTAYSGEGLNRHERAFPPFPPAKVEELAAAVNLALPSSFRRFMTSLELQSRVRSCTDCYLDPGERIVETVGSIQGHLVHFLSDSQSCAHWYLHILPSGDTAVLESPDLFCYQIENSGWIDNPASRLERIDVSGLEFAYCAPSFSDFLYRFWIENEIWYSLEFETCIRPLNSLELDYVGHYASNKSPSAQSPPDSPSNHS
jgi:hypothetical protein